MQRTLWRITVPLMLFGLLVLGFSVTKAFALSPLPVSYQPTPVVVQNNSTSSSTTSTTTQPSGTTTTQPGGATTTGTTATGTTTATPSSSAVVVNSTASPLPVSYTPTPVVYTPTTTSTTTTGTTGTATTGTTTTGTTTTGTTTTGTAGTATTGTTTTGAAATPSSSTVVVNPAAPLPVTYTPTPVVYTPTTAPATTTTTTGTTAGTTGTTGATGTVQPEQPAPSSLTADEAALYNLINEDRADYGVNPVSINTNADAAANAKAEDMINNNYFSDTSPTYGSPSQLLTDYNVSYTVDGECIAEVVNVNAANADFMADPAHESIITDPAYTQVGVSVVADPAISSEVVVEEFIG